MPSTEWWKGDQNNRLLGIVAKPREKAAIARVKQFTAPCSMVRDEGRACLHQADAGRNQAAWQ